MKKFKNFQELNESKQYKQILQIIKENFSSINIDGKLINIDWLEKPCQIETDEMDFCTDIETLLEMEENILIINKDINIEKEISFESEQEIFCQVYADSNDNINRLYLNID